MVREVTEALHKLKTSDETEEEVVVGVVSGGANAAPLCANNMAGDEVIDFEDENLPDEAGALRDACHRLDKLVWDDNDLMFTLQQAEIKMAACGVKKQFTKLQALTQILPKKVQDQVKPFLCKKESEFTNNNAYKLLKTEILRIFGPKPSQAVHRALGRTLTDQPSMLARALVNDLCKKQLDCECCPAIVEALWTRNLPLQVRAGIASTPFNKANFNEIVQLADDIFKTQSSSNPAGPVIAAAAADLDETQPGLAYPAPEVNAVGRGRGGRGGRSRPWRGGGRGGQNGGQNGQSRGGGQSQQGQTGQQTGRRGTKHPDLPPGEWKGCNLHYRWGRSAHF